MPLAKIQFNPGVDKEGTEYTADAGWFDSDRSDLGRVVQKK